MINVLKKHIKGKYYTNISSSPPFHLSVFIFYCSTRFWHLTRCDISALSFIFNRAEGESCCCRVIVCRLVCVISFDEELSLQFTEVQKVTRIHSSITLPRGSDSASFLIQGYSASFALQVTWTAEVLSWMNRPLFFLWGKGNCSKVALLKLRRHNRVLTSVKSRQVGWNDFAKIIRASDNEAVHDNRLKYIMGCIMLNVWIHQTHLRFKGGWTQIDFSSSPTSCDF